MDVVQHYLSEIDLTDVPSELRELLSEAATTNASDAEVAICVAYNIKQGKNEVDALKSAGVDKSTWKKIKANKLVYSAGKKVAKGLKNIGGTLIWSGKTSASTFYKNGKKEASKADLVGNNRNRLSVKQASSSAKSAQLVSGTSGEAIGVFEFAVKHLEASGGKLANESEIKELFDIFEKEMSKAIRTDINVEVGKGKKDFRDWVISDSGRYDVVKSKAKQATDDEIKRIGGRTMSNVLVDYKVVCGSFIVKTPGPESVMGVHQDMTLVDETEFTGINIWCPLVDLTDANGVLKLIPKSHRISPTYRGSSIPNIYDNVHEGILTKATSVYLKSGQAIAFDQSIIHCSPPNVSDHKRVVTNIFFSHKDVRFRTAFYPKETHPDKIELFEQDITFMTNFDQFGQNIFKLP